jgi:predicted phosphodiesterase
MNNIRLQLGNPFLIAIYSLALLLIGAAIGARWGCNPHVAVWLVVLGAALMVAHDMLSFSIIFLVSTAWALRASRKREVAAASTPPAVMDGSVAVLARSARKNQGGQERLKMLALVISDIHANLPALEAVLAAAPKYDVVWNLGDVVGYGGYPNEVVQTVRKLGGTVIRGNHDRACGAMTRSGELYDFSANAAAAARWTQGVLTTENKDWLTKLPRGPVWTIPRKAQCVHGAPWNEDEYLFFREDARTAFHESRARIVLFGHTHWQVGWSLRGPELTPVRPEYQSQASAEHFELSLRRGWRYLINPGSVGQPRDGDWRAAFAIYDEARALLTWHRVPYKVLKAQMRIRRAELPEVLATRLREGK